MHWPGGRTETFSGGVANGRYRLVQGSGRAEPWPVSKYIWLGPVEVPSSRIMAWASASILLVIPNALVDFSEPARLWKSTSMGQPRRRTSMPVVTWAKQQCCVFDKKECVLEIAQEPQVEGDAQGQQHPPPAALGPADALREGKIAADRGQDQDQVLGVPVAVENQRGDSEEEHAMERVSRPRHDEKDR